MASKQFETVEYHGKGDLDKGLARHDADGWELQTITVTSARCAWGLLFGLIGFWAFERHNVFHATFARSAA